MQEGAQGFPVHRPTGCSGLQWWAACSSPGASSCKDPQFLALCGAAAAFPKFPHDNYKITCKPKSSECLQMTHSTAQRMIQRKQSSKVKIIIR